MSGTYKASLILSCFIFFLISTRDVPATEEYADQTGKDCSACHIDPSGGSELTSEGLDFQRSLVADEDKKTFVYSVLRFIVGYIHILTAIFWFGTILYVHLILKPVYAAQGLPKGEVKIGLASMAIMLITGSYLTIYRIPSFAFLVETKFGILLVIKVSLFLLMITAALFAVFYIGPRLKKVITHPGDRIGENLTADDLRFFDGKKGRPAYIAFQNKIYDVTKSSIWYDGIHFFRHPAGIDLTAFLKQAPHGEDNILKMPGIGNLVSQEREKEQSQYIRIFYFLAYFNLALVLLIVFIIALWRWA
jgi:predicted heme/steroid binding protein/uncharacterized membrane protein